MKKTALLAPLLLLLLVAGCSTRSISNSDYEADRYGRYGVNTSAELTEFDVLGIDRNARPTDEEIARRLAKPRTVGLNRSSKILLIQSGAVFPDAPMTQALSKRYTVGQFSGVKTAALPASAVPDQTAESYSRSLRMAAAQGGHDKILVYWGVLESGSENLATSTVSWIPIVGWVLPDERQRMRIRLRLVLIDVASGQWEMYSPEPLDDRSLSTVLSRRETDQALVNSLKERAYIGAAEDVYKRFER